MTTQTFGSRSQTAVSIDDRIKDRLSTLERQDSVVRAEIVDIVPIGGDDVYNAFDINTAKIIPPSNQLIKRVIDTDEHQNALAVAAKLHGSGDIFLDVFKTGSAEDDDSQYPMLSELTMSLGVDQTAIDELVGENVYADRSQGRWRIRPQEEDVQFTPSLNVADLVLPPVAGLLLIPLFAFVGIQTGLPTLLLTVVGLGVGITVAAGVSYLYYSVKRGYQLPDKVESILVNDTTEVGSLNTETTITDVSNGRLKAIKTTADADDDSLRSILWNTALVVDLPPVGEQDVALGVPITGWDRTTAKHLVYDITYCVEALEQSNEHIPLTLTDGRVMVDTSELQTSTYNRPLSLSEDAADSYIEYVNDVIGNEHTKRS